MIYYMKDRYRQTIVDREDDLYTDETNDYIRTTDPTRAVLYTRLL